jgi:hypothetical protein
MDMFTPRYKKRIAEMSDADKAKAFDKLREQGLIQVRRIDPEPVTRIPESKPDDKS